MVLTVLYSLIKHRSTLLVNRNRAMYNYTIFYQIIKSICIIIIHYSLKLKKIIFNDAYTYLKHNTLKFCINTGVIIF